MCYSFLGLHFGFCMKLLYKIKLFLTLYRYDVAVVTFMASLFGYILTDNFSVLNFFKSLFISLISYNFVYSLNSLTDVEEDLINKPHRPIPSGRLPLKTAQIYVVSLLLISLVGTYFLFSGSSRIIAFLIPFIGIIYSLPPVRAKKIPVLASFVTGWGMVHPLFVTGGDKIILFTLGLLVFAVSVTIFKDIEDLEGDTNSGLRTVLDVVSPQLLLKLSLGAMIFSSIIFFYANFKEMMIFSLFGALVLLKNIVFFKNIESIKNIYKYLILSVIFSIFVLTLIEVLKK